MDSSWFPSDTRPLYQPEGPLLVAFSTQIASLLIPSRPLRFVFGATVFLWCCYYVRTHSAGDVIDDYLIGVNLYWIILRWLDLAILRKPETTLWEVDSTSQDKEKSTSRPRSLTAKVRWVLSLCTTYRGIGWNWRVAKVDYVRSDTSKRAFVTKQLLKAARIYVIMDFLTYYNRNLVFEDSASPDISELPFHRQVLVGWSFAIMGVCGLSILSYLTAALTVSLGLSRMQSWPPVFGSFMELYTIRKAWGYCWHQFLRRLFEVYTEAAAQMVGLRSGTLTKRYFKLYGSFVLSAFIHMMGALNIPWSPTTKYHMMFFLVQPLFITLEDFVVWVGKSAGVRKSALTRALGYLWVVVAFSITLPLMTKSFYGWHMLQGRAEKKNPVLVWSFAEHLFG